jgi:cyclic beta-1,2-glucan synthetase
MRADMVGLVSQFRRRASHTTADPDEEPIRGELYSVEHLEQYARELAAGHKVFRGASRGHALLPRLEENARRLTAAYRSLAEAIREERAISPAAEWLVDNFHIVEEQLREIRQDLPRGYYYELPKLSRGDLPDYPRIYAMALALIAHTDSRLEVDTLKRFIGAYQEVSPLSIGEVWAVAITLRLALVDNLRRIAALIIFAREQREQADKIADRIVQILSHEPDGLVPFVTGQLERHERPSSSFVAQMARRLRDQDPAAAVALDLLDRRLVEGGQSVEQLIQSEYQQQAASQVTVANIITSMRLLSTLDWRDFFESVSLVDSLLGEDPAGAYSRMDFATRDRYRHVIERVSKRTKADELEVAKRAVGLARQSYLDDPQDLARAHVGFYLIDRGLREIESDFGYRLRLVERINRLVLGHPTLVYLGSLALLTLLLIMLPFFYAYYMGAGVVALTILTLFSVIPASDVAVSFLNWVFTSAIKPRSLPKIDLSPGIPENTRTMVVVPAFLTDVDETRDLLERLEVHYLANNDDHLHFALLTDFADAPQEKMPDDEALLEAARIAIARLNDRYSREGQEPRFHLFHRKREWNPSENKWMGWERKRGKIHEFNRLLRGARDTTFVLSTADESLLAQIRFIITLDADTQLPRDAARRLVGTILHPLNRARLDPLTDRVIEGYGILQPRVSISLESAGRSRFARTFSGNTGVDPYTTAVSDLYQDLFNEGIYTGKALYDVDVFEAALASRIPENSLLSHDLFEGLFARAALVTDIEVFDEYPSQYDTFAKRLHRWVRGDWQIARWVMPRVPDSRGRKVRNRLPLISRWKILDNLRRSLVAPTAMLWLVLAWLALPASPLVWTLLISYLLAFPIFAHITTGTLVHPRGIPWTSHFWSIWGDAGTNILQVMFTITFLAHQSYLMSDAILRTLYRKIVSHRHLLEWITAAQALRTGAVNPGRFVRFMWPAQALAVITFVLVSLLRSEAVAVAAPFVLAWLLSPFIACRASRPISGRRLSFSKSEERMTRLLARRTWRYFEVFVGEEDHWLPPDNYQEEPQPVIAHRTSPTNVGLLVLSTVAAHDFGYVGSLEMVERLELTFSSFEKLPRFRSHFFNWYDTRTLEPLIPQFVSTVDSGNFAGHLLAVKQACLEVSDRPLLAAHVMKGLADGIAMMSEEAARLSDPKQRAPGLRARQLRDEVEACALIVSAEAPSGVGVWVKLLDSLDKHLAAIEDVVNVLAHEHGEEDFRELRFWVGSLIHQSGAYRRDIHTLMAWVERSRKHIADFIAHCPAETRREWRALEVLFDRVPVLSQIPEQCDHALARLAVIREQIEQSATKGGASSDEAVEKMIALMGLIERAAESAKGLRARLACLARLCDRFIDEMDFHFLFDEERKVLTIGYNVTDGQRDNSFYDLLASEARLASFIAIATGDVPQEHWFRLGRPLTTVNGKRVLISWSATMFEYLMPLLVMRSYEDTLLDQTHAAAVARQIEYGKQRGVPWGVSESAYNAHDLQLNYRYGPFGVPGMGLKRGLGDEMVVAPYATILAAMIEPHEAMANLRRLERAGALSRYGFYEAIDYTPERLPQGQSRSIIRAFMTHHQGMSLIALDNVLHDRVMQKRFHADPLVQATEMLLQERIPRGVPILRPRAEETKAHAIVQTPLAPTVRRFTTADLPSPRAHLLSNGTYSVMTTTSGAGYSMRGAAAVTRWREDTTRDHWGSFCYLRDVRSGAVWSAGYQPTARVPQSYEVSFSEDRVAIERKDVGILTQTEIIVSPEDDAEVRRVSITNQSAREREIEVTSYAEIVLAPPADDAAHPAFSNLSIETEFVAAENTLLARRRARSESDEPIWAVHTVVNQGESVGAVQYETDRRRFLGRGHTPAEPLAIIESRPLSNTVGAVLDPIFSLRARVVLQPGETARICFATAVADSRDEALRVADKYHDASTFDREAKLAWTKSQVELRHLGIDAEEANLFQHLAGHLIYSYPSLRPRPHVLALNTKVQQDLWPYGIGGDLPILLVRISQMRDLDRVRQILRAHQYLRTKGLIVDLVILNDHPPSYSQALQDELHALVGKSGALALLDKAGGIYLRRTDIMPEGDRILIQTAARACIVAERGSLEDHLSRQEVEPEMPAPFIPSVAACSYPVLTIPTPDLDFFNGQGGFARDGREYVIMLAEGQWTPAPWINVVANEKGFGFQVSETGAGCTWSINSGENRLTPWSNDAVSDPPGEVIYLRDEDTGATWTPTPLPIRAPSPYLIRHGQGYTVFEHTSHGISHELLLFAATDASVKISLLRLKNQTDRTRSLSVTYYSELVMGGRRGAAAPFIITEIDEVTRAILAHNPYNNEFARRVAFLYMSERGRSVTCDRKEFVGRNGSPVRPAALHRAGLSGRVGAGLDPCATVQAVIDLAPGETREIVLLFGEGKSVEEARAAIFRYKGVSAAKDAFERVNAYWNELLGRIEVRTPDRAMDLMMNRWLLYQTYVCRMLARSAFYQSSGAYGFRDQLQDSMALLYARPDIAREHILRAASRQFKEGDVQHWWHPPTGRGVRSRSSDDLLWLPYVTSFYISLTNDWSVLDEEVPFIEGPLLEPGEEASYLQPVVSAERASLYEHCARALDRSLSVGSHGLPLIGAGDWNDGMNRVGHEGRGESVWLGWFLYSTLKEFSVHCDARKDEARADIYRQHMKRLKDALEEYGWDGNWYLRAYFDDGSPLGSAQNEECRIDSIAQSWAVISGAADPARAARTMAAAEKYLIRRGQGIALLFTPPFDRAAIDPGYVKAYAPGVRENGAQYTHAAVWLLIAYTMLGEGDRASELFALLNPINHALTRTGAHRYKVEPYVVAADVYSVPPHTGRGGWTWYTGAAGWMYRAGLESMLGFRLRGDRLRLSPCIARSWREYEIIYRRGPTVFKIRVENPNGVIQGVASLELDGKAQERAEIKLIDDGKLHSIRVILGEKRPPLNEGLSEVAEKQEVNQ